MNYFFDLDNTLCVTNGLNYHESTPIINRIKNFFWRLKIALNNDIKSVVNDINFLYENNCTFNR